MICGSLIDMIFDFEEIRVRVWWDFWGDEIGSGGHNEEVKIG